MSTDLLPQAGPDDLATLTDPTGVVEAFLAALADDDLDRALALLDEDVLYVNVGLPAIRGRRRVASAFGGLRSESVSFEVYLHAISATDRVVLTERTDVIVLGPCRLQFWVWGRFEVEHGQITLWRDSFDVVDILRAVARGLVGIAVPSLRPKPPASPDDPPGR
jgi:limonene-1,2-epoxide hydrolase